MYKATHALRATAAAATIAGIAAGGLALALPAFAADTTVTGYETGYTYHQGLANGDGAMLMAADNQDSTSVGATDTGSTDTSVSTAPAVSSDGTAVSVAPAPATPAAPVTDTTAVQPAAAEAATPSLLASMTPANWAGIALIALAILIGIVALAAQPRRTRTVTRTYQRYS